MRVDMINFKGSRFEKEIILTNVYWYLRYSLSYRDLEEMAKDRGLEVDHSSLQRWVIKFTPQLEEIARKKKKPVGTSWRMDETYVKVNGKWKYLYRGVDKDNNTIDYLLTANRDKKAAKRFIIKSISSNGIPKIINIDKSGSNTAAIEELNKENKTNILIRQCKYLNNIVEQDHRFIKKIMKPMLGFKNFWAASITLAGIEIVRMIKKGQIKQQGNCNLRSAEQFFALT
jgi:putative transposase